jgi:hypothetical protein
MHCGDPTRLCATCLEDAFASDLHALRARAAAWADDIAATVLGMDWPADSDALTAIARLKVTDLGRDPRLLERLAQELLRAARERWLATKIGPRLA